MTSLGQPLVAVTFLDRSHSIAPPDWSRWLIPPAAFGDTLVERNGPRLISVDTGEM